MSLFKKPTLLRGVVAPESKAYLIDISRVRMGSGVVGIGSVCDSNCTGNHVYCRYALCAIHCMWETIRFELMGGREREGGGGLFVHLHMHEI